MAAGWGWAAAIAWLSLTPAPPEAGFEMGDKAGHLAAYGVLMLWFCLLYRTARTRLAYGIGFVALGIGLEIAQGALGYRTYEVMDMAANAAGVLAGWAAAAAAPRIAPR